MLEQSILELAGYQVAVATSAEEALQRARGTAYGLFLVDVEMPGMDGFAFVERVRADPALHLIPAIMVTSRESPEDLQRGRDAGAQGYIAKNRFNQAEFLAMIARLRIYAMARFRVLVVEDSLTVRKRLAEVLASDPEIEVVGEAENGKRAIELCQSLRPDVVTMDMMLPVMSGLAATEYIMAHCPTPILVVSASTNRGELFKTYEALAAGALDVLEKPSGDEAGGEWERHLISAVKLVARIRVISHPRSRLAGLARQAAPAAEPSKRPLAERPVQLVAIGASTGGPGAIVDILRALPASFRLPVLFVLHIGEPFGAALADWLDDQTGRPVAYARDGEAVASLAGRVAMAPAGRHLVVRGGRLCLTSAPERHSCRPSVDVLFESVAEEYGAAAAACLLTGMGKDGAAGLLRVRQCGGLTIAQDEATSIVYGMPREATALGAVMHVLRLEEIGRFLSALTPGDATGKAMTAEVLIVDDSLTVRMDLKETLEAAGLRTALCATIEEARAALARETFSLVVLDLLLPDGDGIDLLEEIRLMPSAAATAVMLLSTETEIRDRIRGLSKGADEYVGKPYEPGYVAARARELVHRSRPTAASTAETVLIIDDSPTFREELRKALSQAGYNVIVAGTGEEGLQLAANLRPNAVVVDGILPGIDGPTVIRRIRFDAALRGLPCLLLTASDDGNAEIRALDAGADTFVRKDEDIAVILARLGAAMRGSGAPAAERNPASLFGPKKILAVDDSETYLQEIDSVLRSEGYEVVLARSGEEAVDLLSVQSVDCILLDLLMPGMDGQETCRRAEGGPDRTRDPDRDAHRT